MGPQPFQKLRQKNSQNLFIRWVMFKDMLIFIRIVRVFRDLKSKNRRF